MPILLYRLTIYAFVRCAVLYCSLVQTFEALFEMILFSRGITDIQRTTWS